MNQLGQRIVIGLILCFGGALFQQDIPAIAAPPGWHKVWSDEFEGDSLDTTKWEAIDWTTPHNNERQAYHPSQVSVSEGHLALTAITKEYGGKAFTSGKVESKWTKRHGRWEVRAKLPGTLGTWPAIWLLPDTKKHPWPTQGEIDIMENRGNQPHLTSSAFHYGPGPKKRKFLFDEQRTSVLGELENFHKEFHVYAVEWDEKKLRFFVDDVHYFTIYDAEVGGFLSSQTAPVEVQLNVAVGGEFLKDAQPGPSSSWPQQMLVDYVRVYERAKDASPVVFKNGGFEADGGSLKNWSTFGNKIQESPNVQVHNESVSDGAIALKLFGQSSGEENHSGVAQAISVSPGDSLSASVKAYIRGTDSISDTKNHVDMKIDYYSEPGARFGSSAYISSKSIKIADGNTANDQWHSHTITDTVPTGAVEARLALVFTQPNNEGGAVHLDEVAFRNLDVEFNADANNDGRVDGLDFMEWQKGLGKNDGTSVADGDFNYDGVVNNADRAVWESKYNQSNSAPAAAAPKSGTSIGGNNELIGLMENKVQTHLHKSLNILGGVE